MQDPLIGGVSDAALPLGAVDLTGLRQWRPEAAEK